MTTTSSASAAACAAQRRARMLFWGVLAGATVFRLAIAGSVGFSTDEAHYVLYSRRLAWGYFDHPPMVGFLGALTGLAGRGEWFMRLGPVLCWAASLALLRLLALAIYRDERVPALAAIIMVLLPVQQLTGIALLPDATLNVFWCGAMLTGWNAVRGGGLRQWLLLGLCAGCALLSKYHAALLPLAFGGAILSSRDGRRMLGTPYPYLAGLVALAVFLPNIAWNWQNDWISYKFQLSRGSGSGRFDLGKLLGVIGGQLAVGSPLLAGMLPVAWFRLLRGRGDTRDGDRFIACFGLVVFGFFCFVGLFGKLLPHWTAVGWWGGALALAAVFVRETDAGSLRWRRWRDSGLAVAAAMSLLLYAAVAFPLAPALHGKIGSLAERARPRFRFVPEPAAFKPEYDVANDLFGWKEAAVTVAGLRAAMPRPDRTFVFCHRFFAASQLLVYLPEGIEATAMRNRNSQYALWFDDAAHEGWDALFVDENHAFVGPARYAALFDRVDPSPEEIVTTRHGFPSHILRVYRCHGYRPERRP